jgi:hypothetical protein
MKKMIKYIYTIVKQMAHDTLQKEGKWSRTSLTMFTAWVIAIYMAFYDMKTNGFHIEVFLTFVGIAAGVKVIDAYSTKIEK